MRSLRSRAPERTFFEKCTHQEYFVDVVKDKRMSKNGVEFLVLGGSTYMDVDVDS